MSSDLWSSTPWTPLDSRPSRPPLPAAPRHLPSSARWALALHGPLATLGVVFFAMGTLFTVGLISPVDLVRGPLARTWGEPVQGIVERVEDSNVTVNEEVVQVLRARFELAGTEHTVSSYSVAPPAAVGDTVGIHVVPGSPSLAVVHGMMGSSTPWMVVPFLFLFPLVGLGFLVFAVRRGARWSRVLERGLEAEGTLISDEETNTRINNVPVRRLTFHFQDGQGDTWPAVAKGTDTSRLTDEPTERVLYLPEDPRVAIVVDEIPTWLTMRQNQWGAPPASTMGPVWLKVGGIVVSVVLGLLINQALG